MNIFKMVVFVACALWLGASPTHARLPDGFRASAERLLRRVRLPAARLLHVPRVLDDLERALQSHWPGCAVTPFGAIIAGLGFRDSDVDCFVKLPEWYSLHERTIFETRSILEQHPRLFLQPTAVDVAREPHVRFIHAPTGLQCDVSFGSQSAVRNTALIKYLMRLDRRVLDLTAIVKYWSKLHKPPGERRIMSNYAMISLVIFYLQQVKLLPPISYLQTNVQEIIFENWEMGFNEIPYRWSNNDTLFQLLGGFFQYYNSFDFDHSMVSIFAGVEMKRSVFENVDTVPDIFAAYKHNVANLGIEPLNITTAICVQEVFLHNSNIASASSPKALVNFKSNLEFATKAFEEGRDDFLEVILEGSEHFQSVDNSHPWEKQWSDSSNGSCRKVFMLN